MKKIILLSAILFSFTMSAQEAQPTLEQQGDLIKGTFYHDNGTIRQQGFYKDGKLQGEWISYDRKGNKTAIGQYNQGAKSGKWFFWKGKNLTEVDYSSNKIAAVTKWSNKEIVMNYEE